ncbi:MAG: helix-turn-helix transcriptional regulator [Flavobacterium sp.]|nr:helix-turn-helix transcriptional regulator [Flavobacterium sp.]
MELATFFTEARKRLGYKTKDEFADAKNYTRSQYSEYESGTANPTVETIFNLLFEFGLKPENLFKLPGKLNQNSEVTQIYIPSAKIEQLREQVKLSIGLEVAIKLTDQKATRILRTLAYCTKPKSKADILSNLGLKNTTNNFHRAIGHALEFKWLEMTNPESRQSPEQRYVITEEGKRVV